MDHKHDHLPEVVQTTNYPEVVYHQQGQYQQYPKPEDGTHGNGVPYSAYSTSQPGNQGSPQFYHTGPPIAAPAPEQLLPANKVKRKTTILGCSVLMFTLCAIIALLSVAVIGLAAGTGIEANRANTAEASSSTAQATVATSSTSFAELDDNCSGNPDGVTGTTYDAFSLLGNYSFTIQCNKDALGTPLMALFTSDIDTCMDSCAAYSGYTKTTFGSNNTATTCGGISFIPLWTNKTIALAGGAPGNCYLKPTQTGDPSTPNIGTECHAAVLVS